MDSYAFLFFKSDNGKRRRVKHLLRTGTDQKKNHKIIVKYLASLAFLFFPMHFAVKREKERGLDAVACIPRSCYGDRAQHSGVYSKEFQVGTRDWGNYEKWPAP